MKINEVKQKAENLIEVGEQARQQEVYCRGELDAASSQLSEAYDMLDYASRTNEKGETQGDVAGAQARVYMAQAHLESCERALREALETIERIKSQKYEVISQVDQYNETESGNLSSLELLRSKKFGENAAKFVTDLLRRMNAGEETKARLLNSMGIAAVAATFQAGMGTIGQDQSQNADVRSAYSGLSTTEAKIRNHNQRYYSAYINPEEMNRPMSESVVFVNENEMKTLLGDDYEPNILGFNDNVRSYINVESSYVIETTVHENLHQLSSGGIMQSEIFNVKNEQMNEGITEYLTKQTLGAEYPQSGYSLYDDNMIRIQKMTGAMGSQLVEEAYFQNKPELIQQEIDSHLGSGTFDRLSKAFDDSIRHPEAGILANNIINEYVSSKLGL